MARELGTVRSIEYLMGIESEIAVPEEELAEWTSRVQINLGCIPGGYAWVFPKRDHLSVGIGRHASKPGDLHTHYQKFLNSLSMSRYTIARSGSHLMPKSTKGRLIWQDRALLLGDAAGLADPLTGEGTCNATRGAHLAAPVIEGSSVGDKVELQDYQQLVKREVMSKLRIARTLSKFFVRFPHLAFGMFNQGDELWKALCGLMLGETNYAAIKERAGGFKGIFKRLFRA